MVTPMIIVYELVAITAAAIAVVAVWHKIQVQKRISAIDTRLAKMQKEIEVLQMQESRRVMMTLKGNSNVESPGLDPDDAVNIDRDVMRFMGTPSTTSVP
jgi:hypothetical protein